MGTELVKRLCQNEIVEKIIIYDNLSKSNYNLFIGYEKVDKNKVSFVEGDILDTRKFKKALEGIDTIFHLAAKVTTPYANNDPHFFEQVNHWGTAEVVYAVEESDVEKFIFLSSTSVYGASKNFVSEDDRVNPRTFYGISKMRGEEHVRRLTDKRRALILRSGNIYGYSKSMRFDAVINLFMFEANFKNRISIHGSGNQSRGFIHIDTLTNYLDQVMVKDVEPGIYNLVEKNLSVLEIVDVLKEKIYPSLEFIFINQHMKLREMRVEPNLEIYKYLDRVSERTLEEELLEFKEKFTF